jgi:hypothetical protein
MRQLSLVTTCHTCEGSHLSDEEADEKWRPTVVRQNNNPIQKAITFNNRQSDSYTTLKAQCDT